MHNGENILVFGFLLVPALLGVAALVGSILLFRSARTVHPSYRTTRFIAAGILAVIALGVGACYGVLYGVRS